MPKIKINSADIWFSKALRESYDWTCQRCHKQYGIGNTRGLENSHFFGRGNYSLRYSVDNCDVLCTGDHFYFSANPNDYHLWKIENYGEGLIQILREKRNDIELARSIRRNLKEVTKHYKAEYERIRGLRAQGRTGRIALRDYE